VLRHTARYLKARHQSRRDASPFARRPKSKLPSQPRDEGEPHSRDPTPVGSWMRGEVNAHDARVCTYQVVLHKLFIPDALESTDFTESTLATGHK